MTITLDTPIKFLREDGSATHANKESYPVNRWMRVKGPLEPCENGYHYTTPQHWRKWLTTRIHLLEAKEPLFREDKFCARGIKLQPRLTTWTPRTVALFAADCAERVLPIFERAFPDDPRPRQAIMVVRSGSASEASEASEASVAAARAARAASWAAAMAAARAARAASEAARAASWAARAASWAASEAARAASEAASWAASGAASEAASEAASWAARAASEAASEAASWAAARAARAASGETEAKWQDARFLQYLNGEVQ